MAHIATDLTIEEKGAYNGANMFTRGYLITTDAAAVVEAANYLNASASRVKKGTIIDAVMAIGGTPVRKSYVVTSATGAATVVIALQTATAG